MHQEFLVHLLADLAVLLCLHLLYRPIVEAVLVVH